MLVLSRRPGETIRIGDDIVITIVGGRGSIKLGIEAPLSVRVFRGEVYDALARANSAAAEQPDLSVVQDGVGGA